MSQETKDKISQTKKVQRHQIQKEYYADFAKINGPDICWEVEKKDWMFRDGEYRDYRSSRKSWAFHNGAIPNNLNVCHHCDNPICINPKHLFIGTQQDNLLDAKKKGRLKAMGEFQRKRRLGVPLPLEQVAKFKATLARKKELGLTACSPEKAEKIRKAKLKSGYHHSPETIAKIKAARATQIITPESIAKRKQTIAKRKELQ
jgi:hypothetical protein